MTYEQVSHTIFEQSNRIACAGRRVRIILFGPDAYKAVNDYFAPLLVACHNPAVIKGEGEFCGHKWRLMNEPGVAIFHQ